MRSAKPSTVPPPPLSVWPDLAALRSVLRAAVGGDAHALLDAATNAAATLVGGRGSCVMLAADGGAHVVCSTEREIRQLPINLDRYPEMREAIATRRVVHAPDVASDPRFDAVRDALPAALRSTCVVPIANDDGCPALLVVQSASTQVVDARGLEVLALLGEVTAAALAQAHAAPDDDAAVLVITSGDRRVDEKKVAALVGKIGRADAGFVKARTGFTIGGVSPVAHAQPPVTLIDRELYRFDEIWAAAGHPHGVFRLAPADLEKLTQAPVADVVQPPAA